MARSTPDQPAAAPVAASWRQFTSVVLIVIAIADVAVQVSAGEFIPPVTVMAVLGLVAAFVVRRPGRAGPITALIIAILSLVLATPFALGGLGHPESPTDFLHAVASIPLRIMAAVAALGILRGWSDPAARRGGVVTGAIAAACIVAAVIAPLATSSDAIADGDAALVAEGVEWSEDVSVAPGGTIFVDNRDPIRHTFVLDETDVAVELPASTARRVTLDLPAGEYDLRCSVPGHEQMTGTVTVD